MKGKVTKTVAKMIPGTAKIILMSCACNHGPNQPWAPNIKTYINPATTGETENGKSTRVVRNALPLNSYLAIAQAAAIPNTKLSGTAIAAVSRVNRIADHASGSCNAAQ